MSLVGFKAKNHPQQTRKRGADDGVDERITPDALFDILHARHDFTLDVAASKSNAKCRRFFDLNDDGLKQSWANERVWCNPPWSNCAGWVEKAVNEVWYGECHLAVLLLPSNRTEQGWWQQFIEPLRDRQHPFYHVKTNFMRGRLRFGWPAGRVVPKKGDRPPSGVVIVTFTRWQS